MSLLLFNNELVPAENTSMYANNRGFLYGDGFFETLVIRNGHVYFLDDHFERASLALNTLMLQCEIETSQLLYSSIQILWKVNHKPDLAIVKWMVWRDSEGLYEPTGTNSHTLLELKPYREPLAIKSKPIIAESIFNVKTIHSAFKSLSSLHYVLAGIEKKKREADEIIILDNSGNISEANSSSIFWIVENEVFTPALSTGCIAGITRKKIIELCKKWNIKINEVNVPYTSIPATATVFTSNIAGISLLKRIEGTIFANDSILMVQLKEALARPSFSQNLETIS
jgi:branched-subunit amino acid aminotransferase/4-amino-4-deoxychorismate lyase